MKSTRLFLWVASVASIGLLSACTQQAAAPIRSVESGGAPIATVAIPVAPPTTDFGPRTAETPASTPPAPIAPATASAAMVGGQAPSSESKLALVQVCQANAMGVRDQCAMGFADTQTGREVTSQVQSYFLSTSASLAPKVSFDQYCSPGWLATVVSSQGTVEGGGVLQTQAAVCGHPSAGQALTALFDVCDVQSQGGCRQSTSLKVAWGYWSGMQMSTSEQEVGRPYPADRFAEANRCQSALPIVESDLCPSSAAVPLRLLGLP